MAVLDGARRAAAIRNQPDDRSLRAGLRICCERRARLRIYRLDDDGALCPIDARAARLDEIVGVRAAAWRADPTVEDRDAHDAHADHLCVIREGRVVGVSRLCVHSTIAELPDPSYWGDVDERAWPGPFGALTRLAVAPAATHQGLAARLTAARVALADRLGVGTLLAGARAEVSAKFSRSGFTALGPATRAEIAAWKLPAAPRAIWARRHPTLGAGAAGALVKPPGSR
jgi:GNAT superfamily N-acetyltransferase